MDPTSLDCQPPIWNDGRFSPCVQNLYIENLIPIGGIAISLISSFLIYSISRWRQANERLRGFQHSHDNHAARRPPYVTSVAFSTFHGPYLTWLEGLLLVANLSAFSFFAISPPPSKQMPIGLFYLSIYCLILWIGLLGARKTTRPQNNQSDISLGLHHHLGPLYTLQWICFMIIFLSNFNDLAGSRWDPIIFLQGGCSTAILLLHATTPRVRLEASQGSLETIPDGSIKEASASLLSRWCFSWVGSVVWKALKTPLETTDLYPLSWDYQAAYLSNDFQNVAPARYRMIWRIYLLAKYDLLHQGIWAAIFSLMSFCPAVLLRFILAYMESPETMSRNNAWLCIVGLLITGLITAIADCQCEWLGRKLSLKLRAILINEVFTKVLRRRVTIPTKDSYANGDSKKETHASDGNIFNLMAVDAASISEFSAHTHLVWVNFPLQLTIASVVLYSILGISGILGVILMIVLLPLNLLISERQVAAQRKVLTASDARVQASNEAIKNIRTIKLCAWEDEFRNKVRTMRNAELSELRGNFFWWSISITVFFSLPFITTILTLFIYTVVEKQELETKVAFPALATFAVLRIPLDRMASSISFIMKSLVSVRRIEKFLKERETGKYDQFARGVGPQLGFRNASFQWHSTGGHSDAEDNGSSETLPRLQFQLSELDTNFQKEGLNVIFGPSGSGKSSMLLALLGEMELLGGKVNLGCSHLAYCPQEPWILNQSIRANILFGQPLDTNRYRAVLSAVSLIQDLIELDEGDMTLAGERGSRLSGGQKQRVALARALYSNSEILLLDDCLSALDHRTGRSVFLKAIKGPLMKNRTCILATHHTQLVLPRCDYGVCLDNGRVKLQGTATELAAAGLVHGSEIESFEDDLDEIDREILASTHSDAAVSGTGSEEMEIARGTIRSAGEVPQEKDEPEYQEEKSTGAVSWSVIRMYLRSMGSWWFWVFVLVAFVCQQLTSLGTNLWVKKWAAKFDSLHHEPVYDEKESKVNSSYYLTIYGLIALMFALASFIRDLTVFSGALKASSQIFDKLLDSILYARLLFFDKVPFGQITNRFSKDIKSIDQDVTPHSMSTFYTFCSLATVMILISALLPVFLPVAAIICVIYYLITRLFINSARDLKRIEAVRQSPMYQHFGEALTGSVSIRAYGHTERFTEENHRLIDGFNEPNAMRWASKDWLTLRIASLSAVISWLTGTFLLWGLDRGSVNAGVAGLALTYAATFTDNVLWFVELYSIVQQSFNSVERVAEYMQIVQEPSEPLQPEAPGLSSEWPTHGSVRFRGYTTSYSLDLDSVLRDLDIDIPGGQRVAIVGRTGAGKSSLALALIRVLEADTGNITIDGVDIASVSLKQLRQTVTIVPQDPTLFDGSLRDNIDPFHKYSETELNDILRDLQLFKSLQSENLDHPAAALSQGQRQLVCIARALLRRSRVLVLDEATASIDHATDALIQSALRSTIAAGTTIITVAHRLSTIADYDKVVVLEAGRVVEQGSVTDLLAREDDDAFFHKLCEHSGDFDNIKAIAYGKI